MKSYRIEDLKYVPDGTRIIVYSWNNRMVAIGTFRRQEGEESFLDCLKHDDNQEISLAYILTGYDYFQEILEADIVYDYKTEHSHKEWYLLTENNMEVGPIKLEEPMMEQEALSKIREIHGDLPIKCVYTQSRTEMHALNIGAVKPEEDTEEDEVDVDILDSCEKRRVIAVDNDSILAEAHKIVNGDRQKDYGNPKGNFEKIAKLWSAILGVEVTWQQVIQCMIQVKVARLCNSTDHRDSWLDIAGYAAVWEMGMKEE